ncbi:hypothetical protein EV360DRAFT_84004 [Lentinula raphanica]|nr:hypothetical protein EV360DRAFT_84004 [Lentinula raphanica]
MRSRFSTTLFVAVSLLTLCAFSISVNARPLPPVDVDDPSSLSLHPRDESSDATAKGVVLRVGLYSYANTAWVKPNAPVAERQKADLFLCIGVHHCLGYRKSLADGQPKIYDEPPSRSKKIKNYAVDKEFYISLPLAVCTNRYADRAAQTKGMKKLMNISALRSKVRDDRSYVLAVLYDLEHTAGTELLTASFDKHRPTIEQILAQLKPVHPASSNPAVPNLVNHPASSDPSIPNLINHPAGSDPSTPNPIDHPASSNSSIGNLINCPASSDPSIGNLITSSETKSSKSVGSQPASTNAAISNLVN